jgi:hypothetical protein
MGGISIPALLPSTCVGIAAGNRNKERAGFSGIREARTDADAATEERMIQLQLQPEIEAELAAERLTIASNDPEGASRRPGSVGRRSYRPYSRTSQRKQTR